LLVSPPRERPRLSRLGLPVDFLLFDPAPCGQLSGRNDLRIDVCRRLVAGTGGVLVGADHPGVDRDRPLRALLVVGVAAQLIEDHGPGTVT
jgi:hypothetical protein